MRCGVRISGKLIVLVRLYCCVGASTTVYAARVVHVGGCVVVCCGEEVQVGLLDTVVGWNWGLWWVRLGINIGRR